MVSVLSFALTAALVVAAAPQQREELPLGDESFLLQLSSSLAARQGSVLAAKSTQYPAASPFQAETDQIGSLQAAQQQAGIVASPYQQGHYQAQGVTDPAERIVTAFLAMSQQGSLAGPQCEANAANLFTTDAVMDNRGPTDTGYFKKYPPGVTGMCEYFMKSASYEHHDVKSNMYSKGGRMIHIMDYIPGFAGDNGKKAKGRVAQYNVIRFDPLRTRIAGIEALFDKPSLFDQLKYDGNVTSKQTPQMDIVVGIFRSFGQGKFTNKKCKENAATYFTSDAVVDIRGQATGAEKKEDTFFKKYPPGFDGICDYYKQCDDYNMLYTNASMYARGDDVVMVLHYVPDSSWFEEEGGEAEEGEEGGEGDDLKPDAILQFSLISFNADLSKSKGFDVFYDKPTLWDEDNLNELDDEGERTSPTPPPPMQPQMQAPAPVQYAGYPVPVAQFPAQGAAPRQQPMAQPGQYPAPVQAVPQPAAQAAAQAAMQPFPAYQAPAPAAPPLAAQAAMQPTMSPYAAAGYAAGLAATAEQAMTAAYQQGLAAQVPKGAGPQQEQWSEGAAAAPAPAPAPQQPMMQPPQPPFAGLAAQVPKGAGPRQEQWSEGAAAAPAPAPVPQQPMMQPPQPPFAGYAAPGYAAPLPEMQPPPVQPPALQAPAVQLAAAPPPPMQAPLQPPAAQPPQVQAPAQPYVANFETYAAPAPQFLPASELQPMLHPSRVAGAELSSAEAVANILSAGNEGNVAEAVVNAGNHAQHRADRFEDSGQHRSVRSEEDDMAEQAEEAARAQRAVMAQAVRAATDASNVVEMTEALKRGEVKKADRAAEAVAKVKQVITAFKSETMANAKHVATEAMRSGETGKAAKAVEDALRDVMMANAFQAQRMASAAKATEVVAKAEAVAKAFKAVGVARAAKAATVARTWTGALPEYM